MKKRSQFLLLGTGALLLVSFQNFTPATLPSADAATSHRMNPSKEIKIGNRSHHIESEHLLVKFKDGIALSRQDEILGRHNVTRVENIGNGKLGPLHRVHVVPGKEAETLALLKQSEDVEFAEFNEAVPADATSNDPMLANQWHLSNISAPLAWDSSIGTNSVTVAILDSGVNVNHPDLASRIVPGYNMVDNNTDLTDIQGHGTAVAGSAVVDTNNGLGLASPCWNCKIMPIRVAYPNADGTVSAYFSVIASGMTWAADHGAKITNCSYGNQYTSSTIESAATYVRNHGGLSFASLGNENVLISSNVAPDLMQISATNSSNQKTSFSNYGPVVTLSAPGEYILTTDRSGGYSTWNGTSFASPMVAGVAALVWSTNPVLSPTDVKNILIQSADDLGAPGKDDNFGYGKVNAAKAVALARTYTPTSTTTTTTSTTTTTTTQPSTQIADTSAPTVSILSPTAGGTVSRSVSVSVKANDNVGVTKVALYVDGNLIGSSTTAPFSVSWNTKKTAVGSHNITVRAFDAAGNVGVSASVNVNVSR